MIYADEAFYNENYLLGKKPVISSGFLFYARQASMIIDCYTFGRLEYVENVPEAVMMCCCELAEAVFQSEDQQNKSDGKISEKIGTYSVSFASAKEATDAAAERQRAIVMKWLEDTGLCYQGV